MAPVCAYACGCCEEISSPQRLQPPNQASKTIQSIDSVPSRCSQCMYKKTYILFVYSFIHQFIHFFMYSFIHLFIHLPIYLFAPWILPVCSPKHTNGHPLHQKIICRDKAKSHLFVWGPGKVAVHEKSISKTARCRKRFLHPHASKMECDKSTYVRVLCVYIYMCVCRYVSRCANVRVCVCEYYIELESE